MTDTTTAIIGHGAGLGSALARVFGGAGHRLALLSRSGAADPAVPEATPFATDAGDPERLRATLDAVEAGLGPIGTLLYNADVPRFGGLADVTEADLEAGWRVSTLGLFAAVQHLAPGMEARGGGAVVVTGATAALRGNLWTTAFAPSKAAQRILAQSLAKQLGPKGIHIAYMVVDGVIDTAATRAGFAKGKPDDFFVRPERIAETALMLTRQDRSAWSFEVDLRPFGETW